MELDFLEEYIISSFIESNSQRLNKIIQSKERKLNTKTINTLEKTIMKFDSGREHVRRMIGIFWF